MTMVDIQICTRDRASETAMLLQSLLTQTFTDFDVYILDDASGVPFGVQHFVVNILNRLKMRGHKVSVARNAYSFGVCRARNALLGQGRSKWILRLDDDQVLEPDYIERLVWCGENSENVGIVSGVTPLLGGADFYREPRFVGSVANRLTVSDDGDLLKHADDCGFLYLEPGVLPAHSFRSSCLMRRVEGISYPLGLSNVGFREEQHLSFEYLLRGFRIYVDLGAVAWHNPAPSGGCRLANYSELVALDDDSFRRRLKRLWSEGKLKEALAGAEKW